MLFRSAHGAPAISQLALAEKPRAGEPRCEHSFHRRHRSSRTPNRLGAWEITMSSVQTPDSMTPDERRREVASIIALGVLRFRRMAQLGLPPTPPESCPQSQNGLEVSRESRLHVTDGSAG